MVVYEYRHPFSGRRVELHADSVRVTGTRNFAEFDVTLPLARLDPQFDRIWVYDALLYVGSIILMLAVALLLAVVTIVQVQDLRGSVGRVFTVAGIFGAIGLGLALLNRHKIEHAVFKLDVGTPVLAIPLDRKRPVEFVQFVNLLVERIRDARDERESPEKD